MASALIYGGMRSSKSKGRGREVWDWPVKMRGGWEVTKMKNSVKKKTGGYMIFLNVFSTYIGIYWAKTYTLLTYIGQSGAIQLFPPSWSLAYHLVNYNLSDHLLLLYHKLLSFAIFYQLITTPKHQLLSVGTYFFMWKTLWFIRCNFLSG